MNIFQAEIHKIMNTSRNLNGISLFVTFQNFPDKNKTKSGKIKSEGHPACLQLNP